MINKKRKGFTIVELVVVIVIVGVLAAVLIPTFGSLIRQANESADKQTVYQMNIILASELIDESLEGDDLLDRVKEILDKNGIDVDNLTPSSDDLEFKWDPDNKVVILVRPGEGDNSPTLIYPDVDNPVWGNIVSLGGGSAEAVTAAQLIAITTPGTYNLSLTGEGDTVTLNEEWTISPGVDITLNLNGKTLNITENAEGFGITINGNLTVTGGNITIAENISEDESIYYTPGITVAVTVGSTVSAAPEINSSAATAGSLTLDGVTITGNRYYNIESYGNISLTNNSTLIVNVNSSYLGSGIYNEGTATISNSTIVVNALDGYGVKNYGIANVSNATFTANDGGTGINNYGTATIENTNFSLGDYGTGVYNNGGSVDISGSEEGRNQFVASGKGVTPIANGCEIIYDENWNEIGKIPGTMTVTGTTFKEAENADVSYHDSEYGYGCYAPIYSSGSTLELTDVTVTMSNEVIDAAMENGQFIGSVHASGDTANVKIIGGSFNCHFCVQNSASITLMKGNNESFKGLAFDSLNVGNIRENLCYGYDAEEPETFYSIVETVNSNDVKSFTLLGGKFYSFVEKTIPEGYDVTMHLNIQGFYLVNNNIVVNGKLTMSGDIRVDEECEGDLREGEPIGRIKVAAGGKLYLTSGLEVNDSRDDLFNIHDIPGFLANFVIVEEGGSVYLNEAEYEGPTYTPTED